MSKFAGGVKITTSEHQQPKESLEDKIRYTLAIEVPELSITRNEILVDRIMTYILEDSSRPHPAPLAPRYAPCPHVGPNSECTNRQAGCKYQKIVHHELVGVTDISCTFQPPAPASKLPTIPIIWVQAIEQAAARKAREDERIVTLLAVIEKANQETARPITPAIVRGWCESLRQPTGQEQPR